MSALPSGYPNTGCQIALPSSGRDAWDERWDAGCANSGGRLGQSLPAATRARGDQIAVVAQELARIGEEELRGRVVLHTSGAMDSGVLDALQTRGATVG